MTVIADYAHLYETQIRPRGLRRLAQPLRHLGVLLVWSALFVVRPRLALSIWRERR